MIYPCLHTFRSHLASGHFNVAHCQAVQSENILVWFWHKNGLQFCNKYDPPLSVIAF